MTDHHPNPPLSDEADFPRWQRTVLVIALGAGMASFAMNFWVPFLAIYMKDLGAKDDASALAWVGLAYTGTGVARLVSGPLWGMLADRYGRKRMFVRALFAATLTTLIAAVARHPAHFVIAWTSQGLLSGFIPAAVALTSVSVPRSRLTSALGMVQGAQYGGNTIGPVLGALLVLLFGLRGAVIAGALVPSMAALIVLLVVPRDRVAAGRTRSPLAGDAPAARTGRLTAITGGLSVQFAIGLLVFFMIHMTGGLVRTSAPIVIERMHGKDGLTALTGLAVACAGFGSMVGAIGLSRFLQRPGRLRPVLVLLLAVAALAHAALGFAGALPLFIAAFAITGLCQGAMLPATNTIIAAAVPYERRGAAFGTASSVQALAFIAGPLSAAAFASLSFTAGFIGLGILLALVGGLTFRLLREPDLEESSAAVAPSPRSPASARAT